MIALAGTFSARTVRTGAGRGLARTLAGLHVLTAVLLAFLLGPLATRTPGGTAAFAHVHLANILVAVASWAAAALGLVLASA